MNTILKKELKLYFSTPVGYIYTALSVLLSALFFVLLLIPGQVATNYTEVLWSMALIQVFLAPLLTMRLIAEERRSGTEQLLLTSPIKLHEILLGKYFASYIVFFIATAITFIFPAILIANNVALDIGAVIIAYVGYFLLGGVFLALGIFMSSLTTSQAVAGISTSAILLMLWIIDVMKYFINVSDATMKTIEWFMPLNRYQDFNAGILNISSTIYFLSLIILFLFFTYRIIEKRRWSGR